MLIFIQCDETGKPTGVSRYEVHQDLEDFPLPPNAFILDADAVGLDDMTILQECRMIGAELHRVGACPSPAYSWDEATGSYTYDLARARQAKRDEINAARDAALYDGFMWGGHRFDSDPLSQARVQGGVQLAQIAGSDFTIDWTLFDNSVITLTGEEMIQVGLAMGHFIQQVFSTGRQLKALIDAATDQASLEAITWPDPASPSAP